MHLLDVKNIRTNEWVIEYPVIGKPPHLCTDGQKNEGSAFNFVVWNKKRS